MGKHEERGLDIVIPSKTERFLFQTIKDVLAHATGSIQVYPVLDGYDVPPEEFVDDPRVHYIKFEPTRYAKKRHAMNGVGKIGTGKYFMSLDAHCMMAEGFDETLIEYHQDNWVQIPRRNRLDAENWSIQPQSDNRPPIDYEYIMFPLNYHRMSGSPREPKREDYHPALHGFKWDSRTIERWDVMVDDTMTFQGSCWMMTHEWYWKLGGMNIDRFTGWGQESEELGLGTRMLGGKVMTNKHTSYAHLHKGSQYGRMYRMDKGDIQKCNIASYNYWVNDHRKLFISVIEQFSPVPNWPENWPEVLFGTEWSQPQPCDYGDDSE